MHAAVFQTQLVMQTKDAEMKTKAVITLSPHDGLFRLSPDKALGMYFKCDQHIHAGIYI